MDVPINLLSLISKLTAASFPTADPLQINSHACILF
nr:MAG TPA: hypothetical protein [Caudoviricetes sp.]